MKIFEVENEHLSTDAAIANVEYYLSRFNQHQDYYVLRNDDKVEIVFKNKSELKDWTYCPAKGFKLVYENDVYGGRSVLTIMSTDDNSQRARVDKLYSDQFLITEYGLAIDTKEKVVCVLMPNKTGYLYVPNKSNKWMATHRMVAYAFCEIPEPLKHIRINNIFTNHIDGVKSNNRFKNLEWVTASQNGQHAYNTNLNTRYGENHSNTKHTDEEIRKMRTEFYKSNMSVPDYARTLGNISAGGLRLILRNERRHDEDYEPDFEYINTMGEQSGEQSGNAKITQAQVDALRKDYIENHRSRAEYAQELGVSKVLIKKIVRNKAWYDPNYDPDALPSTNVNKTKSQGAKDVLATGNKSYYKITKADVEWIRNDYKQNQNPYSYYAKKFNVTDDNVKLIIRNKTWYDPNYVPAASIPVKKSLTYDDACWIRQHHRDNPTTPQKFYMEKFDITQYLVSYVLANKSYIDPYWKVY